MSWIRIVVVHTYMCVCLQQDLLMDLHVRCRKKREFKDYSKIFDLSIWKDEVALYRGWKTVERLPEMATDKAKQAQRGLSRSQQTNAPHAFIAGSPTSTGHIHEHCRHRCVKRTSVPTVQEENGQTPDAHSKPTTS